MKILQDQLVIGELTQEDPKQAGELGVLKILKAAFTQSQVIAVIQDMYPTSYEEMEKLCNKMHQICVEYCQTDFREETGLHIENFPKLCLYNSSKITLDNGQQKSSNIGPFYNPGDHKIYINVRSLLPLFMNLRIYGDMAISYILMHEFYHGVQRQILFDGDKFLKFFQFLEEKSGRDYNESKIVDIVKIYYTQKDHPLHNTINVHFELWTDFMAGINLRKLYDTGVFQDRDITELANAVNAVGDDRRGTKDTDVASHTHGTSKQRREAFNEGFIEGKHSDNPLEKLLIKLGAVNIEKKDTIILPNSGSGIKDDVWKKFKEIFDTPFFRE